MAEYVVLAKQSDKARTLAFIDADTAQVAVLKVATETMTWLQIANHPEFYVFNLDTDSTEYGVRFGEVGLEAFLA